MNEADIDRARECLVQHGSRTWQVIPGHEPWDLTPDAANFVARHLVERHGFDQEVADAAVRLEFKMVDPPPRIQVMVNGRSIEVPVVVIDNSPDVPGFVQPPTYEVKHRQHTPTWETWQVFRTFQGVTTPDRHWPRRDQAEGAMEVYQAYPQAWGMKHMQLAAIWRGMHPEHGS